MVAPGPSPTACTSRRLQHPPVPGVGSVTGTPDVTATGRGPAPAESTAPPSMCGRSRTRSCGSRTAHRNGIPDLLRLDHLVSNWAAGSGSNAFVYAVDFMAAPPPSRLLQFRVRAPLPRSDHRRGRSERRYADRRQQLDVRDSPRLSRPSVSCCFNQQRSGPQVEGRGGPERAQLPDSRS